MGILDKIKGNPFEKLKKDDLTAERIRLEREEKLKIGEVERLSKQKKELFDKGFDAGEGERRSFARQIKQFDQKIKLSNIHLKKLSDQIMVVDNMIFIHENKQMLEGAGLMSKLARIPQSKLDEFLAEVNIKDQVMTQSIGGILTTVGAEQGLTADIAEDAETSRLMDIWETSDVTEADEIYEKLEDQVNVEREQFDKLRM